MPNKLPPLKTLPAFAATAKHLSFSKAAAELHVTHSAISQSIKLLEEFLGQPLFNREGGQVSLTEAGKAYSVAITNALNNIQSATDQQRGASASKVLTVNILTTLALRWLIPRLPSFQNQHPEIDCRLSTLTEEIDFSKDQVDVAISYGHADDWPSRYSQKLFDDKLVLVGSPKIIQSEQSVEQLLKNFKAIYVTLDVRKYDWPQWCQALNVKQPSKRNRIYFQTSSQALQAVVSGLGIAVTHQPFISDDLQSGQLIKLAAAEVSLTKSYYFTCPKNRAGETKINCFKEWLTAEIESNQSS